MTESELRILLKEIVKDYVPKPVEIYASPEWWEEYDKACNEALRKFVEKEYKSE